MILRDLPHLFAIFEHPNNDSFQMLTQFSSIANLIALNWCQWFIFGSISYLLLLFKPIQKSCICFFLLIIIIK